MNELEFLQKIASLLRENNDLLEKYHQLLAEHTELMKACIQASQDGELPEVILEVLRQIVPAASDPSTLN